MQLQHWEHPSEQMARTRVGTMASLSFSQWTGASAGDAWHSNTKGSPASTSWICSASSTGVRQIFRPERTKTLCHLASHPTCPGSSGHGYLSPAVVLAAR